MRNTEGNGQPGPAQVRRRDRHGRGVRGVLIPPGLPAYRTRAEQFDDLVLQAVARLEPRWEAHLASVEFAVEEIPPEPADSSDGVPLARVEPGSPEGGDDRSAGTAPAGAGPARTPRIVVYRRPLIARADGEDEIADLVFDVIVEEFARLLGIDPHDVDPGYTPED